MENEITAHKAGTIAELPVVVGSAVNTGELLAVISSNGSGVASAADVAAGGPPV